MSRDRRWPRTGLNATTEGIGDLAVRDILVDYAGNGARSVAGFGEVKQEIEDGSSANRKLGLKDFFRHGTGMWAQNTGR